MTAWERTQIDGLAVLTFTRPPKNWMNLASMTELADLLDELASDEDTTVVMLTGGVDGVFIAHADLDDLKLTAQGAVPEGDPDAWRRALERLGSMPQPTVAAIDGQAWGGGCETALACTMRIGSERAHLSLPEVSIGIIPGAGGTQRLPRLVGAAKGAELVLSGRRVFADEALAIGLLNTVLPAEGFVDAAVAWCERITRWPRSAVLSAKSAVVDGMSMPLEDGLRHEFRLFRELNASDEARRRNEAIV
ncbi:MAG: enoyl-CoA hydratase/isomerase family protein, partial [Actinomycetota bacterium]|nr:enoyl-CoA hydratase/isomerase family protein [Actinomycetota bacterium]